MWQKINKLKLRRIHCYNKTVSKDLILLQIRNTWGVKFIWVDRKTVAFNDIYYFGCFIHVKKKVNHLVKI